MKYKKIIISFIPFLVIIFGVINAFAFENINVFSGILKNTVSTPVEIGFYFNYKIKGDYKYDSDIWLKKMGLYCKNSKQESSDYSLLEMLKNPNEIDTKNLFLENNKVDNRITINSPNVYCREFQNKNLYGYIEGKKNQNDTTISIFMRKVQRNDIDDELENKAKKFIGNKAYNLECHRYLKAETSISSTAEVQNNIIKYLKSIGTENISTVKINNGFSTVAYTKKFVPILDNGKHIDLNFSVLNEKNKNYIIIGTPLIDISY